MPRAELRFEAIGAPWQIDSPDPLPGVLVDAVHRRIDDFDAVWSRFREDSLVTEIASRAGSWRLPAEADALLRFYRTLYEITGGTVTPLVGQRLESLGYDSRYSLRRAPEAAAVPVWDDVLQWDGTLLTTTQPVVLDVGAAGKGYLVDLIAEVIADAGIRDFTVDASGDILHRSDEPLQIALEHPFDPTLAVGVYELVDGALCSSAPGRRTWGTGLHHILDGLSGEPTTELAATWAMTESALVADGLATALFFVRGAALSTSFDFEYVRMFPTGRVERSTEFAGELFT
jgi:thiamine biosynthesis lipoprotein